MQWASFLTLGLSMGLVSLAQEEVLDLPRLSNVTIELDGLLQEADWTHAVRESGFSFPWTNRPAPATEFLAMVDEHAFYFAFRVEDGDIVVDAGEGEDAVARGDRVELFFSSDLDLEEYICVEIDPAGRVLDYRASFYRNFDSTWNLTGLRVAARATDDGYVVEGRIPREAFARAGLSIPGSEEPLWIGVFRAEFSRGEPGRPVEEWISWVPPDSASPDFHIPSAFGLLR